MGVGVGVNDVEDGFLAKKTVWNVDTLPRVG